MTLIRGLASRLRTAECAAEVRRASVVAAAVAGLLVAQPYRSVGAEKTEASAYNGAAVTVVRAKRSCFADTISVSGMLVPREEVSVRPEREGLQISQVPVAGIILKVDATVGTTASARAAPLFQIIARGEFELLGELPANQLSKLSAGQVAKISVAGASEVAGRVRSIAAIVNGGTQLGQVNIFMGSDARLRVGAFGRGQIVIAQSCNVAIPLSAVLYSQDTAVVAVVRNDRVETRQVVVGHLAEGDAEIREGLADGDLVVAKAAAFFREGDRVRPFLAGVPASQK
jgi:hypothetical protein